MSSGRLNVGVIAVLMIVIMIGVTCAILAPVFRDAREMQNAAICMSNMKQLGLALTQYTQDFDGAFPPSKACEGTDVSNRQATQTIVNLLDPYLGKTYSGEPRNPRLTWRCPSQRGHSLYVKSKTDEKGAAGTVWPLHYVCNRNLLRPVGGEFSH